MESWTNPTQAQASAPQVKFENSPAESFVSTPGGDMYSLFETSATSDPAETVMTPTSFTEDNAEDDAMLIEDSDKKPTKKRKSWGQVLPEPKTNLPPRKRAKTEDEKEQRRVERVLRNRRAAQSSRERKRQEVEALEKRNQELDNALSQLQKQNMMLLQELSKFRRSSGVVTRGSSPLDTLQPSPLTLSQPLFGASELADVKSGPMGDFILMPENEGTINPASISPELAPVPDAVLPSVVPAQPTTSTTSSDVTQHPAVSVVRGVEAESSSAELATSAVAVPAASDAFDGLFGDALNLSTAPHVDSWGTQAQFSPSSDPLNFEYHHLDGDATTEFTDLDFTQFLDDDISGAAPGAIAGNVSLSHEPEPTFGLFDLETQVSSENLNQQPQIGASA